MIIGFDAETSGTVNLNLLSADVYTRSPDTRCLCFVYHPTGTDAPRRLWLEGQPPPEDFVQYVQNGCEFSGWNVNQFDRLVYARQLVRLWGFPPIDDERWLDSMHLAAHANLPRSLAGAGAAVGIEFNESLKDNNRLRRITNANRTTIPAPVVEILSEPHRFDAKLVDDLQWLVQRCLQDVPLEEAILQRLPPWPTVEPWLCMPAIDRRINDRGVMVDIELIDGLARAAKAEIGRINERIKTVTRSRVSAATEVEKIKQWLLDNKVELPRKDQKPRNEDDQEPEPTESEAEQEKKSGSPWRLRRNDIIEIISRPETPEQCRAVLAMRLEAGKASPSKLRKMLALAGPDGRLRQCFVLGGAQQTLRWSAKDAQLQNTIRDCYGNPDEIADLNGLNPKNPDHREEIHRLGDIALTTAIEVGRRGDVELIRQLYSATKKDPFGREYEAGPLTWIARMTRRTITVSENHVMFNGDFAQIEARITAWLAQQINMLSAYANGEDVYRLSASEIYHKLAEMLTKTERQAGKVAVLACGFGGGWRALLAMAFNYGLILSVKEAMDNTKAFRQANNMTVQYWYATDDAAANAVIYPGREFPVPPCGLVSYVMDGDCLKCRLPSGRNLHYWEPRLVQEYWPANAYGQREPKNRLSLYGLVCKGKVRLPRSLYHTVLMENQVQAIGADFQATTLANLDRVPELPVTLHMHDAVGSEGRKDRAEQLLPVFKNCMMDMPSWTYGLPYACEADFGPRFG